MGIYEERIKEEKKNILIKIETKKFADIGYWIRDIKKKLNKTKILKIRVKLNIDYFENEIY